MADQIIIELIGDPSGLKPAEEALKELSKVSEENMAAFNKANEAAVKFAAAAAAASKATKDLGENAKEASKALGGIGDAATKSITAISSLNAAITGGAVKAATTDIKTFTAQIKELTGKKEELLKAQTAESASLSAAQASLEKAKANYKDLGDQISKNKSSISENKTEMQGHEKASESLSGKLSQLSERHKELREKQEAMKGTSQENSKEYNELGKQIKGVQADIRGTVNDINSHDASSKNLRATNVTLAASNATLAKEMGEVKKTIKEGTAEVEEHKEALGKTKEEIIANAKETAKAALEHNKFYKAIGDGKEKLETLKSGAESISAGMKKMGIENESVEKGIKKLSQAIDIAKGAQTALSAVSQLGATVSGMFAAAQATLAGSMGVATGATEGATVASTALDVALSPIIAIVAAVVAGVALLAAQFYAIYKIGQSVINVVKEKTQVFQVLSGAISTVTGWFHKAADAARDFLSWLTGGAIDNAALHKMNEELEKSSKTLDKEAQQMKAKADLMEAEGKKVEEIAGLRSKANEDEIKSLDAKIKLEENKLAKMSDEKERAEQIAKIEEMRGQQTELINKAIENQKSLIEKTAEENKLNGMNENQVLHAKEDQIKKNIALLEQEATRKDISEAMKNSIEGQVNAMKKMLTEVGQEVKKSDEDKVKSGQDAYAKRLSDAKATADAELAITVSGSKAELDAKIKDLNAAAAVELNNAKGNAALQAAIKTKLQQDIAAANQAFEAKKLQDEKTGLEAKLILAKKDSEQEFKIKEQLLENEKKMIEANLTLTDNERKKALNEIVKKQQDLDKEIDKANNAQRLKDLKEHNAVEDEKMASTIEHMQKELDGADQYDQKVIDKKKSLLEEQKKLAINQANETIADKTELAKVLLTIDKQYEKETNKINDDITKHEKDNAAKAAKEKQDLDKKMASEAINLGKQVADAIFAAQAQKRQQALDDTINTLENQKNAELSNQRLTAAQKAAIEKKYHAEEAAAKLKAWKADQKAKAEQAIINGLLAFTMTMAQQGYPAGLVTGLLGLAQAGIQAGIILAKSPPKFAKGVIGLEGPGTATSDSIPAYLSRGESVITAERTQQYKPLLEQIQAGTYVPLPIPMLSTLPRLHELSSLTGPGSKRADSIDYEKLGEAVAKALPKSKVQKLSFDKKGFSHYLLSESGKVESYNNRYKE